MIVKVLMLAFGEPQEIRHVQLPDDCENLETHDLLEQVYKFGQNDFQRQPHPSVSVGDVVVLQDGPGDSRDSYSFFRVEGCGWKEITENQLFQYIKTPRENRYFWKPE